MEKRLTRSQTQRSIAGVCGGIAEYFNIDVTVVRLITVFLGITGSGLLLYIAAWLLMPEA
ncbi:MAG: PspC domain-containing protein [Clostridia bacterium]